MEILKTKKYLGMVGNILTLVGTFLPFCHFKLFLFGEKSASLIYYINWLSCHECFDIPDCDVKQAKPGFFWCPS